MPRWVNDLSLFSKKAQAILVRHAATSSCLLQSWIVGTVKRYEQRAGKNSEGWGRGWELFPLSLSLSVKQWCYWLWRLVISNWCVSIRLLSQLNGRLLLVKLSFSRSYFCLISSISRLYGAGNCWLRFSGVSSKLVNQRSKAITDYESS